MVDLLVVNGIVVTMDPHRRILSEGAVAVEGNRIVDVGQSEELTRMYSPETVVDARGKAVLPGLIDCHGHAGHSLVRSLGIHTEAWYKACEEIYAHGSTKEFWAADAALLYWERLRFGTTLGVTYLGGGDSVMRVDQPCYAEAHIGEADRLGARAMVALGPRRPPYPSAFTEWRGERSQEVQVSLRDQIRTCETVAKRHHGSAGGRINISLMHPTPHPEVKPLEGWELEVVKESASQVAELASNLGLYITMDGHTGGTVEFTHSQLGLAGPRSLFSHCTELTPGDIRVLAETGTSVAHNPSAIASILGRCPLPELLEAGVAVGLGSDGGAPDRSFDMFRHIFQCMRYHRRHHRDPRVIPPGKALELATIDAAHALGMGDQLGSIEPGKLADLTLVDLERPHLHPINLPVDKLVYYANGSDVDTVIVDGEIVVEGGRLLRENQGEILREAQRQLDEALTRVDLPGLDHLPQKYWGAPRY